MGHFISCAVHGTLSHAVRGTLSITCSTWDTVRGTLSIMCSTWDTHHVQYVGHCLSCAVRGTLYHVQYVGHSIMCSTWDTLSCAVRGTLYHVQYVVWCMGTGSLGPRPKPTPARIARCDPCWGGLGLGPRLGNRLILMCDRYVCPYKAVFTNLATSVAFIISIQREMLLLNLARQAIVDCLSMYSSCDTRATKLSAPQNSNNRYLIPPHHWLVLLLMPIPVSVVGPQSNA